jgi:hypothetical protein
VIPYRIPIRLWSTVVTQLQKPVVDLGRRTSQLRRSPGTLTVAIESPSPHSSVFRNAMS